MKIDDLRKSDNVEDRRSSSGGSFSSGGSGLPILQLLLLRGSWKTKLVVLIILLLLGGGGLTSIFNDSSSPSSYQSQNVSRSVDNSATREQIDFVNKVLDSTEDFWSQEFQTQGFGNYKEPKLVLYTNSIQTGCGIGESASGPFYCSADKKIYLDISFYNELSHKYGATGDFAMAYVIAHEVGHHIQTELGIMDKYNRMRHGLTKKEANALNVRLELQADYYAGVWAHYIRGKNLLEQGDFEEAMNAAHAVGDDTLQKETYGKLVPDSFTHGTAEQRQRWFNKGFQYGDIQHGDTFSVEHL
ncbi:TPA: neutral zinc metallopeptidase [Streptococcus agalactiae]|nr:neutral zinc metallopeptidase [Streptococcus agalactiae]